MFIDTLLAYLHHVAAFSLVAILFVEMALCKPGMTSAQVRIVTRYDGMYGLVAGLLLVVGTLRVVFGVKGWQFYSQNPAFHAKVAIFVLIAVLSIPPTLRFLRWRKSLQTNVAFVPSDVEIKATRKYIHLQATLILVLLLMAVLMARGIGIFR